MAIRLDEDVCCRGERLGDVGLPGGVMSSPYWSEFSHNLLKATKVGGRRCFREEFDWNNEWVAIHHFGG